MSGTDITDAVFSGGQNEGIERSILPLPQLASVQNARQRKSGRWGKRYGTRVPATTVDSAGNTLGKGSGFPAIRTIGNGFVVVDDTCRVFDSVSGMWVAAKSLAPANKSTDTFVANPRIPGVMSGWLPDSSFYPVPPIAYELQTQSPCAQVSAIGYLWSAITCVDPLNSPDVMIRVVATNPTDQTVAFLQDIRAASATTGGATYPRLVACGATVVLSYVEQLTAATPRLSLRSLTAFATGFVGGVTSISLDVAGDYDIYPYSATQFVLGSVAFGAATVGLFILVASSFAITATQTYTPALPTVKSLSIVGTSTTRIYITLGEHNAAGPIDSLSVVVWDAALASGTPIGVAVVATGGAGSTFLSQTAYSALLGAAGVRCIYGYTTNTGNPPNVQEFQWVDVSSSGVIAATQRPIQLRYQPISRPAVISGQVYLWCTNTDATGAFGYPTLLRIPALSEFNGTLPSGLGTPQLSCPLEASPQDILVATPPPNLDPRGFSGFVQLGTTATYAFLCPALPTVPEVSVSFQRDFRSIHFRHFTDAPGELSVMPIAADTSYFLPGGVLTRVDARGAVESGFALIPALGVTIGSGGALTANALYQYVAIYKCRNANGRTEISGVSPVTSFTPTAGNQTGLLQLAASAIGARQNVYAEIYRTTGNNEIFYLLTTKIVDAGLNPAVAASALGPFSDTKSDASLTSGIPTVLYTQVGQTLPNAFPPPCRFGVLGAQRIFLGGLLRGDVIHASKSILGDQSPSWADNDAFRIVLPANCSGLAWMDSLVAFTGEGIYIVQGNGPDDSGLSDSFGPPVRLPFPMGCIEPRSVITVEQGTFFQNARGLFMLPRGFGDPIPAGDFVMVTLAAFPVITGATVMTKGLERTVRWSCVDAASPVNGAHIIYDLVHNAWSVDFVTNTDAGSTQYPAISIGPWVDGETVMAGPALISSPSVFRSTTSAFDDFGSAYQMQLKTGDVRPFGNMSEGVLSKVDLMVELRSACTVNVTKTTEWGASPAAARVFALAAGDAQVGQISYIETVLGQAELRDAAALSLSWSESSAVEGVAIIAMAIEHEIGEGLKRVSSLARST